MYSQPSGNWSWKRAAQSKAAPAPPIRGRASDPSATLSLVADLTICTVSDHLHDREAQGATIVGQSPASRLSLDGMCRRAALCSMLRRVFRESTREEPDVAPTRPARSGDGPQRQRA